ncbi:MAG: hypothetical protein RRB13_13145 [bacterium]|nr:hypothetical protein [bacterium]
MGFTLKTLLKWIAAMTHQANRRLQPNSVFHFIAASLLCLVTSCMAPVSDTYLNYPEPKADSEVCIVKTSPGEQTVRTDVKSVQNGEFYSVDSQLMRTSKLVRYGETLPRNISESDPQLWTYEGTKHPYHVYKLKLTPGRYQLVAIFPYELDSILEHKLHDKITLKNFDCKAGESYRLFYSLDKFPEKEGMRLFWMEGEQGVIWERWKHKTQREALFDLSDVK